MVEHVGRSTKMKCHSWHLPCYTLWYHISYIIYRISYIVYHISYFIYHISYIIFHISYFIYHIISYHIISYHIISYPFIPYDMIWYDYIFANTAWHASNYLLIRYFGNHPSKSAIWLGHPSTCRWFLPAWSFVVSRCLIYEFTIGWTSTRAVEQYDLYRNHFQLVKIGHIPLFHPSIAILIARFLNLWGRKWNYKSNNYIIYILPTKITKNPRI